MSEDLAQREPPNTSGLLGRAIKSLAEGITGIAASDRRELALTTGHILQGIRAGKFLSIFKDEWDKYKAKGRIKDEFEQSDENLDCLQELLDFIDRDLPDTKRFEAMKNLYLNIAVHSDSLEPDLLAQQLMKVCRSLSSGELIVLLTAFRVRQDYQEVADSQRWGEGNWINAVAKQSGLPRDLVAFHEEQLLAKRLLMGNAGHSGGTRLAAQHQFGLSDLALSVCEWMAASPE